MNYDSAMARFVLRADKGGVPQAVESAAMQVVGWAGSALDKVHYILVIITRTL